MMGSATQNAYSPLLKASHFFNKELFDSLLPPIVFTYQRQNRRIAEAILGRWKNEQKEIYDEITINPEYFAKYPLVEIFQCLVFEMSTVWQAHHGCPGSEGLVNTEKVLMLESIGLIPSSTGTPGGKKCGFHKNSFILLGGRFLLACHELISDGFKFDLTDRYPIFRSGKPILAYDNDGNPVPITALCERVSELSEIKYTCDGCSSEVHGKPDMNIKCNDCEELFLPDYMYVGE